MSDLRPALMINFINRRTGTTISTLPRVNSMTLNKDIRQLCDTFDFDIEFKFSEKIDLMSHDFVEFYFLIEKQKFQVSCGFVEDLVKETGENTLKFQANGRDFLGQFMNVPFFNAVPVSQTSLVAFMNTVIAQSYYSQGEKQEMYVAEYLSLKGISDRVIDAGAESGALIVPQVSDSMIAPIIQSTSDEAFNVVYLNRLGQVVVWGRGAKDALNTGLTLTDTKDRNVKKFTVRSNYSKVFSEVKVEYTGGEGNINYGSTPSSAVFNSDARARQIFQPEIRTFQTGSLVTTAGVSGSIDDKKTRLAQSIMRKANQNLLQVLINATYPYYVMADGKLVAYQVNHLYQVRSVTHGINETMRLVGISYHQSPDNLMVDLLFVPQDTLI